MAEKKLLTVEDKERLQQQLKDLIDVQRPAILKQIQEAREQGDLSENADYDAAKNEQGRIEKLINEITYTLENSEIIDSRTFDVKGIVSVSSTVKIHDLADDADYEFQIVGSEGSDPKEHKISNESPLARAIMGKKVGAVVEVKGIEKPYKVKVVAIK